MKVQIPNKLMIAHLNVNSTRNKSNPISFMIRNNVFILLVSETELHVVLALSMSYLYDRDSLGSEPFRYIRDDIPTRPLKHDFGNNTENSSVEINLQK